MYSSSDIVKILEKDFERSLVLFKNINNSFDIDKPFNDEQKAEFEDIVKKCATFFAYEPKEQSSKYITIYCRFGKFSEILRNKCKIDGIPYVGEKYKNTSLKGFSKVSPYFQAINSFMIKELDNIRIALDNPGTKSLLNGNSFKCLTKFLNVSENPYFLLSGLGTANFRNINIRKLQMVITFNLEKEKIIYRISEELYKEYNDNKNSNPNGDDKFAELLKWIGDKESNNATSITNLVLPESITLCEEGFSNIRLSKAYEKFSLKQDIDDEKNGIDNVFLKEELEQYEHTKGRDTGFNLALAQLGKPSVVLCNLKYNIKCLVSFRNPVSSNDVFAIRGYEDDDDDFGQDNLYETPEDLYQDFLDKKFDSALRMVKETKKLVETKTVKTPLVTNEALLKQEVEEELEEKSDVESDVESDDV